MSKLLVEPGICGFKCEIKVERSNKSEAAVTIRSECAQVSDLAVALGPINLKDLFVAPSKNIVFKVAEQVHCHSSCPVPLAILKCAEVEMDMALPGDVALVFQS
jgi:hypothetical protein